MNKSFVKIFNIIAGTFFILFIVYKAFVIYVHTTEDFDIWMGRYENGKKAGYEVICDSKYIPMIINDKKYLSGFKTGLKEAKEGCKE